MELAELVWAFLALVGGLFLNLLARFNAAGRGPDWVSQGVLIGGLLKPLGAFGGFFSAHVCSFGPLFAAGVFVGIEAVFLTYSFI